MEAWRDGQMERGRSEKYGSVKRRERRKRKDSESWNDMRQADEGGCKEKKRK